MGSRGRSGLVLLTVHKCEPGTADAAQGAEAAPVKTVLFHPVGSGDLIFSQKSSLEVPADFIEGLDAARRGDRPLRKVFDGLAAAGLDVDAVVLLGTVNSHRPGVKPYAAHAHDLRRALCHLPSAFGRQSSPVHVRVAEIAEPTIRHSVGPCRAVLADMKPAECLLTFGAGSFALGVGALMAALEADVPATLVPVDDVASAYRLTDLIDPRDRLYDWLLRHRFWDELAELDPDGAEIWRLLAARQRADTGPAVQAAQTCGVAGLTSGQLAKLAELWPTVQAAFFERAARGEVIDQSLLRAWFGEQLSRRLEREREKLPRQTREAITDLVARLTRRDVERGTATLIRRARQRLPRTVTGQCAAMLRDTDLEQFYAAAATHNARFSGPLPATVIEQAEAWERGDLVPRLVSSRNRTAWPVLGSGDVLVLMGVGLPRDDRDFDRQDMEALRKVISWASACRDGLPRRGRVRLRLLASSESADRARTLATWARSFLSEVDGEAEVVSPLPTGPGDVDEVRARIRTALEAAGPPTGRSGSGSLRDVDEVILIINPGKPVIGHGMIAAGVEWSLTAACILRVGELSRDRGVQPILRKGGRVLRRLGADPLVARLAKGALQRLDVLTALRLLEQGSPRVDSVREATARLHRHLYGDPDPAVDLAARRTLARQRLYLVTRVLSAEPWPACHLAIESLRPSLFDWQTWQHIKATSPALRELERLRNASPYAHLLDKLRQRRDAAVLPPTKHHIAQLLARAIADLGGNDHTGKDDALFLQYERVCAELHRLAASLP